MIYVLTPAPDDILSIQDRQDRYYWSAAAETLLRAEGWVSVNTSNGSDLPDDCGIIATREVEVDQTDLSHRAFAYFEGPLSERTIAATGISVETMAKTPSLDMRWLKDNGEDECLFYGSEFFLDPASNRSTRALENRWSASEIKAQTFIVGDDWTVHLSSIDPTTGQAKPIIVSKGNLFLSGIPLLDIAVRENAFAPLPARYDRREDNATAIRFFRKLLKLLIAKHLQHPGSSPLVKVKRWPGPFKSALTIRHDYDRRISEEAIEHLLDFYESLSLKCSIAFLSYLSPERDIAQFKQRGHEIQVHSHGADAEQFARALAIVRNHAKGDVQGCTIHGGTTGIGFRGDIHYGWCEANALDYAEMFNAPNGPAVPIIRVGRNGIPSASRLFGTRPHISLDTSTVPGIHQLDFVQTTAPARLRDGDHAIIMNHPDLNRAELIQLLRELDLSETWRATQADVVNWLRISHFESDTAYDGTSLTIRFGQRLPQMATIEIFWGSDHRTVQLSGVSNSTFVRTETSIRQIDAGAAVTTLDVMYGQRLRNKAIRPPILPIAIHGEMRTLLLDQEMIALDIFDRSAICGSSCPGYTDHWKNWFTSRFKGIQPPAELALPSKNVELLNEALAILEIPRSTADYLNTISEKTRGALQKAKRSGYTFRRFRASDYFDDLCAISYSKIERADAPISAPDGEYASSWVLDTALYCEHHTVLNMGCFLNEKLVAYASMPILGELAIIDRIHGHADHLRNGVLDFTIYGIVDYALKERLAVRALALTSHDTGIDQIKYSAGFRLRPVTLVGEGLGTIALPSDIDPRIPELYEAGASITFSESDLPAFDVAYFHGRDIQLVPASNAGQRSGLRAALDSLSTAKGWRVLDAGEHGTTSGAGDTTTVHLLDRFSAPLDVVDSRAEACQALEQRFSTQLSVKNTEFLRYRPEGEYDLIVADFSPIRIANNFDAILNHSFSLLGSQGKLVLAIVYDPVAIYTGDRPMLNPSGLAAQERFWTDLIGERRFDMEALRKALWKRGFAALGLVDKWMGEGRAMGMGWLCLEKISVAPSKPRFGSWLKRMRRTAR